MKKLTCMGLSLALLAGLLASNGLPGLIALPVGIVLMLGFLVFMKKRQTA